MLKVTFFIKPVHAGQVITLLDKIAIELAMTPVKSAANGTADGRGKRREVATQIISKLAGDFTPPELNREMTSAGFSIKNMSGFMKSLVAKGIVTKRKSGKYSRKIKS